MKRILWISAVLLALLAVDASAQSLGDVARRSRESNHPKAAKVWTNDDMPSVKAQDAAGVADEGDKSADADKSAGPSKSTEDKDKKDDDKKDDSKSSATDKVAIDGMKAQIASQRETIAKLAEELDIAQREYKLQVANYYADAGNSLRDPKAWQDESKKKQDEIAAKQEAVDKAKQKLADMQEAARKAGFPPAAYQ